MGTTEPVTNYYRVVSRKMIDKDGERTLISAIIAPKPGHINGCISVAFNADEHLLAAAAGFSSLAFDFFSR